MNEMKRTIRKAMAIAAAFSLFFGITAQTLFANGQKEPGMVVSYEAPPHEQSSSALIASSGAALSTLEALQSQFRVVAQQVLPVVVEINVVDLVDIGAQRDASPFEFFFGPRNQDEGESEPRQFRNMGLGSGVIVGRSGDSVYVVTNDHVVGQADEISLTLYDGRRFEASLIGTDPRKDLALIRFETKDEVPIAVLGNSDSLMVGDWAFAVGNPLGFESTVTSGIISAVGRRPENSSGFTDYIQTDAAINGGNSGGALVNLYGEVVGINTWIASNSGGNIGLGFAIPINTARAAIEDIIESGAVQYGWLGITVAIGEFNDEAMKELGYDGLRGGFVLGVVGGSPAETAGILPGDLITDIGDANISTGEELTITVGNLSPGDVRTFELSRLGKKMDTDVTLGLRDEAMLRAGSHAWPGMTVITLTDEMRSRARVPAEAGNVVISVVDPSGLAENAGLRLGDVISTMNGETLEDAKDFYETLSKNVNKRVEFDVYRRGSDITIELDRS